MRLGFGIVAPAALILLGTVLAVIVSLEEMANIVNRTEADLTRRSAQAAVATAVRKLEQSVGDYARWDDATRNLYGEPDPSFVEENLAGSTAQPVFFDTAYLVDAQGRDILGYRLGAPATRTSQEAFGGVVATMIADLPNDGRTFDTRSGIVAGYDGPAIVAVAPVVPLSPDMPAGAGGPRYLAIAQAFDQAAVEAIGKSYLIRDLSISGTIPEHSNSAIISDYSGAPIASLVWTPRDLGTTAQGRVSPVALAMLGLLGVMMLGLVGATVRGVVKLQRAERDARHAAGHDALTGLPNRLTLVERLHEAMAATRAGGPQVAVAYLDLDGFKEVNDSYGHAAGDKLLTIVARAFSTVCGDRLLVRLGGDEFAVVVQEPDAREAAIRLGTQLIDLFEENLELDGHQISLSTSVGVVGADEDGIGVDELLRRADVAMYRAKNLGRDRICVFEHAFDKARARRIAIATKLQRAVANKELTLVYQPLFDAQSRKIVATEALVRWSRQDTEGVTTADFVSIAEESGLIDELGAWTLTQACRDAQAWPDIPVALNVSPAQFRNNGFVGTVETILRAEGLPPDRLEIEVTENFFITHPDQATAVLSGLRGLGVRLALDDFGTGYSSIGYLRRFRFDKIKIDRTLVEGIDRDPQAQNLVQATVHIGRALGLTVAAEGVETEAEAILLRTAGCHELQGYLFARPMPAATLAGLLRSDGGLMRAG